MLLVTSRPCLDAMRICEQKENISSTFVKYGEYKPNIKCHPLY
jgi:hypothetical protein